MITVLHFVQALFGVEAAQLIAGGEAGSTTDSRNRLIELATYIAKRHEGNPKFGLLKLAKILFNVDREYLRRHGIIFTGLEWFAFEHGPFTRDLFHLAQGQKHLSWASWWGKDNRLKSSRWHDKEVVTDEVVSIAEEFIRSYWDLGYREVSLLSHGIAWKLAVPNDGVPKNKPIARETLYLDDPAQLGEEDRSRLQEMFRQAKAGG